MATASQNLLDLTNIQGVIDAANAAQEAACAQALADAQDVLYDRLNTDGYTDIVEAHQAIVAACS